MSATQYYLEDVKHTLGLKASEAIARGQIVQLVTAAPKTVELVDTADTDQGIGIAMHAVSAQNITDGQDQIQIAIAGIAMALAGGAITVGAVCSGDASGDLIVVGVVGSVLYRTYGIALAAAGDTELFPLLISRGIHIGSNIVA